MKITKKNQLIQKLALSCGDCKLTAQSLLGSDWGGAGRNQTFLISTYTRGSAGLTYFSYLECLLLIKKNPLNHLSELLTLPPPMLFSATFTLVKYFSASWHLDFSRLSLGWWCISISQHEWSALFNNLMNTNVTSPMTQFFLVPVMQCCPSQGTRNGMYSQEHLQGKNLKALPVHKCNH